MPKLKNTNFLLKRNKSSDDLELNITNILKQPYMLNTTFLLKKNHSDDIVINIRRNMDLCDINININKVAITNKRINTSELNSDINENYKNFIKEITN